MVFQETHQSIVGVPEAIPVFHSLAQSIAIQLKHHTFGAEYNVTEWIRNEIICLTWRCRYIFR